MLEFGADVQLHVVDVVEQGLQLLDAFLADFVVEQRLQLSQFLAGVAFHEEDRLQLVDGGLLQALLGEFRVDGVDTDFVELVDGHGDVDKGIRLADVFGDARQHLAVVDFQRHVDFQGTEDFVHDLHQLGLIQ